MRKVEEMVAHGGMGDAKAIVHHCGEATRFAETIIKHLSISDPHRGDAMISFNEVIRQCNRVSEIGIHADPGQLLNPATKARAAAWESMKSLGLTRTKKARPSHIIREPLCCNRRFAALVCEAPFVRGWSF
jgi:hypothetical protein